MSQFKILFVDDEEINLLNFRVIFQDRYEIITSLSGEEALDIFNKTSNIGLVISDQRMPGISGVELLSTIYRIAPETIRVLLTAHSQVEYVLDAINRGQIYQYILKPWDTHELNAIIDRAKNLYQLTIENRHLTKELALKNRTLELSNQKLKNVNRKLEEDVCRRKKLEASLKESEERFRKFTTASQDIIILFDTNGKGLYSNPAAQKLLGYSHKDFADKPLITTLHPAYRKVVREEVATLLVTNNPPQAREVQIQKNDKSYLDVELNFFCIALESGKRIVGSIIRDITKRKKAREQLRLSEERLGDLSAMLIKAQDDERRRIAMELHDEFGQSLAALKLQLRGMENRIYEDMNYERSAIVDDLCELRQYVNQQIENVRNLSHDLWPMVVDDLGVDAAFDNLISTFLKHVDIHLDLSIEAIGQFFSTEEQRHLYRLLQESLNNVIKHAEAENIHIIAKQVENDVVLAIHDDGVGFDTTAVATDTGTSRGMGLQAMDERVKILNGTMEIRSKPGTGTSLNFIIAISNTEQ
jgi:PAS domain S-box-containing protein